MKKTWKISIILALSLCLVAAFIACDNNDDFVYVYETDEEGETVTDTDGNPVVQTDADGNAVTAPDTNNDGIADNKQTEGGGGIPVGEDTDTGGWGELIFPSN